MTANVRGLTGDDIWRSFADRQHAMDGASEQEWLGTLDLAISIADKWDAVPPECGKHIEAFFSTMPVELRPECWGKLVYDGRVGRELRQGYQQWAESVHPHVAPTIVTGVFGVPFGAAGRNVKPVVPEALKQRWIAKGLMKAPAHA